MRPSLKLMGLALAAVLDATRAANADLLLLAGDIFESNRQSDAFLERIAAMLAAASAPIPGATSATLTLASVTPADAGNYAVIVTNTAEDCRPSVLWA